MKGLELPSNTIIYLLVAIVVGGILFLIATRIYPGLRTGAEDPGIQKLCAMNYGDGEWSKALGYLSRHCDCASLDEIKKTDPQLCLCCELYCRQNRPEH